MASRWPRGGRTDDVPPSPQAPSPIGASTSSSNLNANMGYALTTIINKINASSGVTLSDKNRMLDDKIKYNIGRYGEDLPLINEEEWKEIYDVTTCIRIVDKYTSTLQWRRVALDIVNDFREGADVALVETHFSNSLGVARARELMQNENHRDLMRLIATLCKRTNFKTIFLNVRDDLVDLIGEMFVEEKLDNLDPEPASEISDLISNYKIDTDYKKKLSSFLENAIWPQFRDYFLENKKIRNEVVLGLMMEIIVVRPATNEKDTANKFNAMATRLREFRNSVIHKEVKKSEQEMKSFVRLYLKYLSMIDFQKEFPYLKNAELKKIEYKEIVHAHEKMALTKSQYNKAVEKYSNLKQQYKEERIKVEELVKQLEEKKRYFRSVNR